jgi:hypothetical protein
MMRARFRVIPICICVIAAFVFATARPALAQGPGSAYEDPTIVRDDTPDGVKGLGEDGQAVKKKGPTYDTPPIYTKWWFWVASAVVVGAVGFLAYTPLTPKARSCGTRNGQPAFTMGCFGDGRSP